MKLLSTIITVLILTLSFGVKSHSQPVTIGGIDSRMTWREIVPQLTNLGLDCRSDDVSEWRCWSSEFTKPYDGYPHITVWNKMDDVWVTWDDDLIIFFCSFFNGCSDDLHGSTIAQWLVEDGFVPRFSQFEVSDGSIYYCYYGDPYPNDEHICVIHTYDNHKVITMNRFHQR